MEGLLGSGRRDWSFHSGTAAMSVSNVTLRINVCLFDEMR